jgi:hypothetical protein
VVRKKGFQAHMLDNKNYHMITAKTANFHKENFFKGISPITNQPWTVATLVTDPRTPLLVPWQGIIVSK